MLEAKLRALGVQDYWYPAGEEGPNKKSQFGIVCLFYDPDSGRNMNYDSARELEVSKAKWQGLGYFYASPMSSMISNDELMMSIGDIGLTVYVGQKFSSLGIEKALRTEYKLAKEILEMIRQNSQRITTSDVFEFYKKKINKMGLINTITTVTGKQTSQSSTNIGHNFPNIGIPLQTHPKNKDLRKLISKSRKFIDAVNPIPLEGGIWTLESRDLLPGFEDIGNFSFHMVYSIINSKFELFPDYQAMFKEIGMEWIL